MITASNLNTALQYWSAALQAAAPELNAADGQLGDGDLGTTLDKCAVNVQQALVSMPQDLTGIFKACAQACAKASGSSFGTLLAVAFLSASKGVGDTQCLDREAIVRLLDEIVAALSARGGATLGDKTMLDSVDAIARALETAPEGSDLRCVCAEATRSALELYRHKPNRIGRARMFADKSVGMDDPGMLAILRMAQGLQDAQHPMEVETSHTSILRPSTGQAT